MNLEEELDRLTAPPPKASEVRRLTAAEIEELTAAGQIKPIEEIPKEHMCFRDIVPIRWGRGTYYGYRGRL